MTENTAPGRHDVIIIGAGAAGLYMLHTCRRMGLDAVVLERGDGVGGTWYWNRYPGARCDVESLDYSYSFDEDLQREWRWAEKYATQPEILAYLEHVADRFDLRRDIRLGADVVAADFDEADGAWRVRTADGRETTATWVVAATGVLSAPKRTRFPGQDDFTGTVLNSARWPAGGHDFTGKRVAVIGTGSTGIQITPLVAQDAAKVFVLQRTPSFSVPAHNRTLTDEEFTAAVARYPERRRTARTTLLGVDTRNPDVSTFDVSEEEVQAAYRKTFDYGGPMKLLTTFNDPIVDKRANDVVAAFLADRIRERVGDPGLAERLIPDHPVGARRLCVDTDYYETLTRDNVELVDLRETPLLGFTPTGVRTSAADHDVDVIVLATGFDAITGPLRGIDPHGRGGASLRGKWDAYPASYLGLMVAGFPNLFTVTGPLSPSVNSNMFVAIEQHVEFIAKLLAHAAERGHTVIEATPEAEERWTAHAAEVAAGTVFPLADSWYNGANIAGKAGAVLPYLGGIGGYQARLDEIAADGFRGFEIAGLPAAAPSA
ncbi:flavin-containing monooxygenase [Streptomyces sp. SHP 1-2]|uniref:flavin-containing monooxygenase n=1 Tax=Streptomyces sp. SHP 1-2 TaxID=2769489 RepID=UPI00223905FC|nr:NAD(P)/FAD-dependent oxidoreductase [Streptomyces sp. SHP 1-2]MCW5249524.1 NAD(P)/FAD-dependent oxidoreductase [Streptomyces sp. SHP 1-2]